MEKSMNLSTLGVQEMTQFELLSRDGGVAPGPGGETCTDRGTERDPDHVLRDLLNKCNPYIY
jgi:hypothetical protein